ncbi:MAG: hypothetical protein KAX78_10965 [Phycisphaerae bacterium]|nr:hypothetical protein [Phycisphaerae bacterium]
MARNVGPANWPSGDLPAEGTAKAGVVELNRRNIGLLKAAFVGKSANIFVGKA